MPSVIYVIISSHTDTLRYYMYLNQVGPNCLFNTWPSHFYHYFYHLKKSVGFDKIPNEVLKLNGFREVLLNLMRYCFESGLAPSSWITPIPKGADKDPCVPLNYRGISLLSYVQKIYSSILNKRLMQYLEFFDLLVDEQNGFSKNLSCVDHIYAFTSAVQNRLSVGQSTFAACIDFQKAFDLGGQGSSVL